MKTSTIIIPKLDNDGADNAAVIETAIAAACKAFGGATVIEAQGFWVNPEGKLYSDAVVKIESAALATAENEATLNAIAQTALQSTDQEAVFLIGFDGEAIIKSK